LNGSPAIFTRVLRDGAIVTSSLLLAFTPIGGKQGGEQACIPYADRAIYKNISTENPFPLKSPGATLALSY
jgi:hypothetical protein